MQFGFESIIWSHSGWKKRKGGSYPIMHFEIKTDKDYNFSKTCHSRFKSYTMTFCDLQRLERIRIELSNRPGQLITVVFETQTNGFYISQPKSSIEPEFRTKLLLYLTLVIITLIRATWARDVTWGTVMFRHKTWFNYVKRRRRKCTFMYSP